MSHRSLAFACFAAMSLQVVLGQDTSGTGLSAPLQFKMDGTFQIAIFQDLHFGENAWDAWGPANDIKSVDVMNKVLDAESPSLAVLNGDLITGENTFLENSTHYVDQIVAPLVQRNLTWASTYGNHDYSYNVTGATIFQREKLWANSRTQQMLSGESVGVTNYYLPVYGPSCVGSGCAPELLLWFFDSRGGWLYQQTDDDGDKIGQPNWVESTVVDWFKHTNKQLVDTHNKTIPSLAFVHIPTNASLAIQESGVDPNMEPGIDDDTPIAQQSQGWCPDGADNGTCAYGGQDVPFMQATTSTPGLMALFSGHDHGVTWCFKWDSLLPGMSVEGNGLNICFSQHSGHGGYGTWERGSRQILVTQSMLGNLEFDTWIRLESGNVVGSVSLNSTYGQDEYPETPDTHS